MRRERRRLAAARGAEHDHGLAARDVEIDGIERLGAVAEGLGAADETDARALAHDTGSANAAATGRARARPGRLSIWIAIRSGTTMTKKTSV